MDNNTVQVKLEATYDNFRGALSNAKQFLSDVVGGMKAELKDMSDQAKVDAKNYEGTMEQLGNVVQNKFKGLNSTFEGVKKAWLQLGVALEAGHIMMEAVNDATKFNTEAQRLARTLNITTNAASGLSIAIGDVHGTTDEYVAAVKGLDSNLKKNEEGMNSMGLVTRDANGELRNQQDLMTDSMTLLREYKEGTDRNIAATALFGKGVDISNEMLALNAEKIQAGVEKADSLNLVVGTQSVEATNKYRAAMNDMNDVLEGLKVTLGNSLMPVLTDFATFCSENGPTAVLALRIAINILTALFRGLALAVRVVWEVVTLAFKNMTESASLFGDVFRKIMSGDFAGAAEAGKQLFTNFATNAKESFDKIMNDAADTGGKVVDSFTGILNPQGTAASGASGSKGYTDPAAEKAAAKEAEAAARKAAAEAKRAAEEAYKLLVEQYQAKMAMYKGDEEAAKGHWDKILQIQKEELAATVALYGENSREAVAMRNKILQTEHAAALEHAKIEELKTQATRQAALAQIDAEESAMQFSVQMGETTNEEMLAQSIEFENRRYQLKLEAAQASAALMADEPVKQQEMYNQIEELEQQHQLRLQEIRQTSALQTETLSKTMFGSLQNSLAASIQGMLTKTMSFRQATANILNQMLSDFIAFEAKKLALKIVNYIKDSVMHKTNLIQKNIAEKAATISSVAKSAAMAGAAGTASFAGAPWPIDIGAPAFGAAMFAASMAYGAGAAAEQGYDVPVGVNPITQLHQKEMVLPAAQADVIRDMAAGGTSSGGEVHVHIDAVDGVSVAELFRRQPQIISDAVKRAHRQGHLGSTD
jgi:hypothetical protein